MAAVPTVFSRNILDHSSALRYAMRDAIHFLILAWKAYRICREKPRTIAYVGRTGNGVCNMAIIVGLDREAWRVTQRAIEELDAR